jgi:hypothetical protein
MCKNYNNLREIHGGEEENAQKTKSTGFASLQTGFFTGRGINKDAGFV